MTGRCGRRGTAALPVIASRIGAIGELVTDGETGLRFTPGNVAELTERIRWALAHPQAMADMGVRGRSVFEARYSAERNYALLLAIYRTAMDRRAIGDDGMTAECYKRFPPGLGHLRIPLSSRRAAAAGVALYTACRWSTLNLQRLAFVLTRTFGPRVLPGPISHWSPPFAAEVWHELQGIWRIGIGEFDTIAVYERHGHRQGFMMLLIDGGSPIAFVKLRRGSDALVKEAAAIRMAHGSRPQSFFVPRPLGSDTVQDWSYLATAPLPQGVHRVPARPELHTILADVARALAGLSRPDYAAEHWQPMHGDFAPWNLRRCSDGRLVLFDWEAATWGPPRADEVFYLATHAALKGRQPDPHPAAEAIAFWMDRVTHGRASTTRDERLRRALASSLARMATARG